MGEYAYLCEDVSSEEILKKITSLLNRKFDGKLIIQFRIVCTCMQCVVISTVNPSLSEPLCSQAIWITEDRTFIY